MGTLRVRRKDGEFTLFFRKVSPFSNHHPAEFDCGDSLNFENETKRFSCTEQYYMYNKASLLKDRELMVSILESDNPKAIKSMCSRGALGRAWSDSVWNDHKENVMYIGSLAKYRASRPLRYALFLSTGSRLVECSPFDLVWGIGKDLETVVENPTTSLASGMNLLGKILDRVREELWDDEQYRDEREELEKRLKDDKDYLMKAMKHVDLVCKARATTRVLMSKGHVSRDTQSYLTPEARSLLPDWALPPPIERKEPIRQSPPQVVNFPSTPPRRTSITPPSNSSRLAGRLSITIDNRRSMPSIVRRSRETRSSSSSKLTWERSPLRSPERERRRRRSRSRSRHRRTRSIDRRSRSRSRSRDNRKRRRRSESREDSRSMDRKRRRRDDDSSGSEGRSESPDVKKKRHKKREKRSESREERHRRRKERKREKKEKKKRQRRKRRRRRSSSSEDSSS